MKPEFSRQIFEKYSLNFMKIRPVGADLICAGGRAGVRADGRTGRLDEADSFFSQFCKRAWKHS